ARPHGGHRDGSRPRARGPVRRAAARAHDDGGHRRPGPVDHLPAVRRRGPGPPRGRVHGETGGGPAMTQKLELAGLLDRIREYGRGAFLITVGDSGTPHVVSVAVDWDGATLTTQAGRTSRSDTAPR